MKKGIDQLLKLELTLQKFIHKGEKTGWTYVKIAASQAHKLKANTKKSFRIKGKIDALSIKQMALIPIGEGDFILPIRAEIRKKLQKEADDKILLFLAHDASEIAFSADLLACLEDEPLAASFFKTLTASHQRYFSNWIESAKTLETKTKRITQSLFGLANAMNYGEMIRHFKNQK